MIRKTCFACHGKGYTMTKLRKQDLISMARSRKEADRLLKRELSKRTCKLCHGTGVLEYPE